MTRFLTLFLAVLVAFSQLGGLESATAQTDASEQLGGAGADVNCPQLQSENDAQTLYDVTIDTDGEDIYELDGSPEDEMACNAERTNVNTEPLASCADLREPEHAEALFVAGGADDPYNLDPNGNDIPCDGGVAADETPVDAEPIPSDLPSDLPADLPPLTVEAPGDCDVEVRAGRAFVFTDCADGSVDAGFEPFAGFDEFAASAENGFGAFDDAGNAGTTSVEVQQAAPVNGSTGRTTSQPSESSETRLVEGEQQARDGKAKQAKKAKKKKARKAKKNKRKADRKAKRMRQARSFVTDNNGAR